ncbi:hypothetical protein [Metabacillus litoralis]|uniref:hypothetical protein n=1 Tax=Metabacillus litoralis TaxID=152268 RepID=UPI00203FC4FF|nr:hypothetical protein [Metabacillus litoralis]MCM3409397.1 hypothetical protein [Metabacillus litoralis]
MTIDYQRWSLVHSLIVFTKATKYYDFVAVSKTAYYLNNFKNDMISIHPYP